MSLISDISSVSTHTSEEDEQTTQTLDENISLPSEPQNMHLYFDDEGNECSYEEYRHRIEEEDNQPEWGGTGDFEEPEEDDEPPHIRTPLINQKFVLKHPRVILAFLRFIDLYNELADPEEVYMLKAIPQSVVKTITSHSSVTQVPPEFQSEVNELLYRLDHHADLSTLSWD